MPVPSPRNPISPARGAYATLLANISSLSEGELVWATDLNQFYIKESGSLVASETASTPNIVFIGSKADLPSPSSGVITLGANVTYFITDTVDLTGDRLVASANTTIIGGSSENCRLKSTGLTASALITSAWSLPIRNIAIEAAIGVNLDATSNANQALDWTGVNFVDCPNIGTVKNYGNFIFSDGSFLNSSGLKFDGTIGTIAINNSLLSANSNGTLITFKSTCTVTRRFRIVFSSAVASGASAVAILAETGAIIPNEGLIVFECNFTLISGATGISGLGTVVSSNIIYSRGNKGIDNTAVNGQLYMQGNTTATTIATAGTFAKIAGVTTPSADNAKYTHSNNRLTNDATRSRKYLIQFTLSFTSGAAHECEFGFYDSKLATVRTPSRTKTTTSGSGRAENVTAMCVVDHIQGDYIEVWGRNNTTNQSITVTNLNLLITEV